MLQKDNKPNGCVWLVCVLVLTGIVFSFLSIFIDLKFFVALLIAFVGSIFLVNLLLGKPELKSLLGIGVLIVVLVFGIRFLSIFLLGFLEIDQNDATFSEDENVKTEYIISNGDSTAVYLSHRNWQDNYGENFETDLAVRKTDYDSLHFDNNQFQPNSNVNFWGQLYDFMYVSNAPTLDLILENFQKINASKKLDQMQFAEMVISCIQDIPYSYVFQESCEQAKKDENDVRNLLNNCPECCIGNVLFGVQNPVSFMQNLKGDCDTRTVLIYSILKRFNYDVAILNSDYYLHSIIGINLPATGSFKIYNGKKYMAWETTSKYYSIGNLSPSFNDMKYWDVVITSK